MAIDSIYLNGLERLLDEGYRMKIYDTATCKPIYIPMVETIVVDENGKEMQAAYWKGTRIISLVIQASNEVINEIGGEKVTGPLINLDDVIAKGYYLYFARTSENKVFSAVFRKEPDRLVVKRAIKTASIVEGLEELSKSFTGYDTNGEPSFCRQDEGTNSKTYQI